MRKLAIALALIAASCAPRGYYVSNVYSVNGALVQEKCEISYNGRSDPSSCHVEPVAQVQQAPAYAQPAYAQPPAAPAGDVAPPRY
jgi:hypothetical protein